MTIEPPSVRVYESTKLESILGFGLTVFFVLGTLAGIGFSIFVVIDGEKLMLVLTIPMALMFGIAAWAKLEELSRKLVIDTGKMSYKTFFTSMEIPFDQVKGYRFYFMDVINRRDPNIEIHTTSGDIAVLNADVNDFKVLLDWTSSHFVNLSQSLQAQERAEMVDNATLGKDRADRLAFIERARVVSWIVNGFGAVATVLLFLVDLNPYTLVAAILVFPVCVAVVVHFKGVIYYNNKTDSAHPYVALGLLAIAFGGFSKGIFIAIQLVDLSSLPWLVFTAMSVLMTSILVFTTKEFVAWTSMDKGNVGAFLFAFWLMSFGMYVMTNQILDTSLPKEVKTIVTGKSASDDTYTIDYVASDIVAKTEADVSESLYRSVEKGDTITLQIFSGRWKSPWYQLSK